MKNRGSATQGGHRASRWVLGLWLLIAGAQAIAAVTATVDRNRVAMGDSLRLTITSDADENVSDIPMTPLTRDFDILQRSTSSSVNIVNGRRTHTRQLLIDLMPRRQGTLTIPALPVGSATTPAITIEVAAPPGAGEAVDDETVVFSAELDREAVYVQGQVLLTLRVQVAVSLESPSISELKLDGAFVKQLSQNSYQRTLDGRSWRVHEIRYAIFPEQSGQLEIPSQTFTARESVPRRSLFDRGGGRHLRRSTEPLSVEVLPRPPGFPGSTWLPALDVVIEERWSTPPSQLRAGESTTRTIQIVGHGLQGAQLPPVLFSPVDGIKYYPDQPTIEDREDSDGLIGVRRDSAALVPTRSGTLRIPELRVAWWDTQADALRYATLPERTVTVQPAELATTPPVTAGSRAQEGGAALRDAGGAAGTEHGRFWQWMSAVFAAGWMATLGWIIWSRRRPDPTDQSDPELPDEKAAFRRLIAACAGGQPELARQGLIDWCAAARPGHRIYSLDQVQRVMAHPELDAQIDDLNRHLYGSDGEPWDGMGLADLIKRLRKVREPGRQSGQPSLALYPESA